MKVKVFIKDFIYGRRDYCYGQFGTLTIELVSPTCEQIAELDSFRREGRTLDLDVVRMPDLFCPRHGRQSRPIEVPGLACDCR